MAGDRISEQLSQEKIYKLKQRKKKSRSHILPNEKISYLYGVSEKEERKFDRVHKIYQNIFQDGLKTLRRKKKTQRKPNLVYLVKWLNPHDRGNLKSS